MKGLVAVVAGLMCACSFAQCPPFNANNDPLPKCTTRTDHELCILAAHKDGDRLADFEFYNGPSDLKDADPLACKLRMAAIRQHVLYHGARNHGDTSCKRAYAVFVTNSLTNGRVSDLCEQIGFPKCGVCRHGGKSVEHDDGKCECKCSGAWGGPFCSECKLDPTECLNGGNVSTSGEFCECSCSYPWSGVHCEQCTRQCKNGGFSNPIDPRCGCQCSWPWNGKECEVCEPNCVRGRNISSTRGNCGCECPALARGDRCEQCTARCLNGGILDQDSCTCKCVGGWTGHQCETCDVSCKYEGTFIANECRCKCTNPYTSGAQCERCSNTCHGRGREVGCWCEDCEGYWSGKTCSNCTLRCSNGGELNDQSCKCACDPEQCIHGKTMDDCTCQCDGYWRGNKCDQCQLNCHHGTLDKDKCQCICDANFGGPKCDRCLHNCTGRGLLDAHNCVCKDCVRPYYGHDCALSCTKNCKHGSVLDFDTCTCLGCELPWTGPECSVCTLSVNRTFGHAVCAHGTFLGPDSGECKCQCEEGWGGKRCDVCTRECAHGILDHSTCTCSCDTHWVGDNCTDCGLVCLNGGVLDRRNCHCECGSLHSGTTCQGGPCNVQQSCDACLSTSDGCEWCGKTATCLNKPGPNKFSTCLMGPVRQGLCPPYGECHICDYTPEELRWLALNCNSPSSIHEIVMTEPASDPQAQGRCNEERRETWCEEKGICVQDWIGGVNGPCKDVAMPKRILNGFISPDHYEP